MAYFSQRSPLWATKKVGFGKLTMAQAGCALSSIANLNKFYAKSDNTPQDINELAKKCGAFNVDMLSFPVIAEKLGYDYQKMLPSDLHFTKIGQKVIAETNYYAKVGVPQHFVFYNPLTKKRLDPLDQEPSWEDNNYPIVSYRILTLKKPVTIKKEKVEQVPIPEQKEAPSAPQEQPAIPETVVSPFEIAYRQDLDETERNLTPWYIKIINFLIGK